MTEGAGRQTMRTGGLIATAAVAAALLSFGCGKEEKPASGAAGSPPAEKRQQRIEGLKERLSRLKAEMAELEAKTKAVEQSLEEARGPAEKEE